MARRLACERKELSADGTTWTIPAARYKSNRDLLIPLSAAAQKIIAAMPDRGDYVFTADGSHALGGFAERKKAFDKVSGVENYTLHDLRRTARTLLQAQQLVSLPTLPNGVWATRIVGVTKHLRSVRISRRKA